MSDKRQNDQLVLAFAEEDRSEAPKGLAEGTESLAGKRGTESPAIGEQLMEEVCERENCKQALARCETPSVLEGLEQWFRRRLRSAIWKQWQRGSVRFAELRKRDVGKDLAAKTAGSAHGPWRLADSLALHVALPNAYFDSLGIPRLTGRR